MNQDMDEHLRNLKTELLDGMRRYMRDVNVAYGEADIQRCGEILDRVSAAVAEAKGRKEALDHVRSAILDLNALNSAAQDALIETDQREMICEFIMKTCAFHGFSRADEDVTEEWREW
jgi:hypothetical protein